MKQREDGIYKKYGIYGIINKVNGKIYIGKTMVSFCDRWDCHKAQLRSGYHDNPHLQKAWNKYGEDSFEFAILHDCSSGEDTDSVNALEIRYISEYQSNGKMLYNISPGGDGGQFLGKHLSEETKRKIGEKNRINMTGRKFSEETKRKMSESQKTRYEKWTEQDRAEWGRKVGGQNKGLKWSDESRSKMKGNKNGAKLSEDQVREIRKLYEVDKLGLTEISEITGIKRPTVYLIATYRRWKEIA